MRKFETGTTILALLKNKHKIKNNNNNNNNNNHKNNIDDDIEATDTETIASETCTAKNR